MISMKRKPIRVLSYSSPQLAQKYDRDSNGELDYAEYKGFMVQWFKDLFKRSFHV